MADGAVLVEDGRDIVGEGWCSALSGQYFVQHAVQRGLEVIIQSAAIKYFAGGRKYGDFLCGSGMGDARQLPAGIEQHRERVTPSRPRVDRTA